MTVAADATPELEGVTNFRDVGKTINEFLGNRQLREGLFFRSARLGEICLIAPSLRLKLIVAQKRPLLRTVA